jgi:beta-1,4-mannosyl-glycoprotein beta-1,4-N-acetylglucosaminyltransferase
MKTFDCFLFFNEFELLHLRFMEYYDFVDYFVLVEATKSLTGKPKPLYYQESKERFKEFGDKIISVVVDDMPEYRYPDFIWPAEYHQRNCIMRGLEGRAKPEDKIFVSDCDELWDTKVAKDHEADKIVTYQQDLYYYYVNCKQNSIWNGSIALPYGLLQTNGPQAIRNAARWGVYNVVSPGGWHYSYMGGASKIKEKVENLADGHDNIDRFGTIENIQSKMDTAGDLLDQAGVGVKKEFIELKYTPKKLPEFLKLYPNFYRKPQ